MKFGSPLGKNVVGCRWVYTVKLHSDGSLARLKAHLVAKGYSFASSTYKAILRGEEKFAYGLY